MKSDLLVLPTGGASIKFQT